MAGQVDKKQAYGNLLYGHLLYGQLLYGHLLYGHLLFGHLLSFLFSVFELRFQSFQNNKLKQEWMEWCQCLA